MSTKNILAENPLDLLQKLMALHDLHPQVVCLTYLGQMLSEVCLRLWDARKFGTAAVLDYECIDIGAIKEMEFIVAVANRFEYINFVTAATFKHCLDPTANEVLDLIIATAIGILGEIVTDCIQFAALHGINVMPQQVSV